METAIQEQNEQPTIMQMTLEKASKIDVIRTFGKLTMADILNADYPSVGQLKRYYPIEKVETAMSIVFLDLSASFEGALNEDDCAEISIEVSSSILANLSFEDIYFACRKIKTSKVYGKLTINKILSSLNDHFEERTNLAALQSYNQSLRHKHGASNIGRKSTEIEIAENRKYKEAYQAYAIKNPQTQPTENGK